MRLLLVLLLAGCEFVGIVVEVRPPHEVAHLVGEAVLAHNEQPQVGLGAAQVAVGNGMGRTRRQEINYKFPSSRLQWF